MASFSLVLLPCRPLRDRLLRPFRSDMLMEEERERGLAVAKETAALDRARPLSLRDMLEKEGCRPREKLRTERLDDMTSEDGKKICISDCHRGIRFGEWLSKDVLCNT